MGTVVLRPHDFNAFPNRSSPNSNRQQKTPAVGLKIPGGRFRRGYRPNVDKFPATDLVMEKVTILKRGEEFKKVEDRRSGGACGGDGRSVTFEPEEDLVLCSTDRLGPDPEMLRKQIRVQEFNVTKSLYAGSSASVVSPPPSSVPLPVFFSKNKVATSDLRRLLRLDLF